MTPSAHSPTPEQILAIGRRLDDVLLKPLKTTFVGKDDIIDLLGISLVAGENLFLLGPPGTAKSALVQELSRRLDGRVFDYLLTRFTEPNELFGPFDIRKLREGELTTNTEGMLPEASIIFLDELLNANSAILNSLLMVLNERVFRRGRETIELPVLMVVGASNRLPDDEALEALFDRFLLRVRCDNVPTQRLQEVLDAGWRLESHAHKSDDRLSVDDIQTLQRHLPNVDVTQARKPYVELVARLRDAGIAVSDRRAVKLQRLVAASAVLCGRTTVTPSDFWPLEHIWDREEQEEILRGLVRTVIKEDTTSTERHPRALINDRPDPDVLARDLETIAEALDGADDDQAVPQRTHLEDRLGILASRCQWINDDTQRQFLETEIEKLWARFTESTPGDSSG